MSESSENLIKSETNQNVATKKMEKSQDLIDEAKEIVPKENEQNGLESENQNGTDDEKNKKNEWEDLLGSGSLMKKIVREGQPDTRPQRLERCFINYKCMLEDGTLVEEKENFEMLLGDCEVGILDLKFKNKV